MALVAAPLQLGVINKTKAWFAGRVGPPVLQPYYDLIKLARKDSVFSTTTTWVFRAGPVVSLVTAVFAVLLDSTRYGDCAGVVYRRSRLVGLSLRPRPFLYCFVQRSIPVPRSKEWERRGKSRSPALPSRRFFWACWCSRSFPVHFNWLTCWEFPRRLVGVLRVLLSCWSLLSWFIVLLAENCRIPFDDPNTHLELTMIHEVMVLDHSGPALGMILVRGRSQAVRVRRTYCASSDAISPARRCSIG